ncbi:hypothetical protein BDZ91DRAFT_797910 [Kalaharituber pfeilii]|nr:hypothetical protein BDZ91DRAFT_797910 [Kalaharituber pfeilii]
MSATYRLKEIRPMKMQTITSTITGARKPSPSIHFGSILGNKGLKEWRYRIGKADSPECRWCGMAPENLMRITTNCKPWKDRMPDGVDGIRQTKEVAKLLLWTGEE